MEKVIINFKYVVAELKSKELKLCFVKDKGIFVENAQGNLYIIEVSKHSSHLDRLIKEGVVVEFNRLDNSLTQNIADCEKEIWGVLEVEAFIERHSLLLRNR
ncbi:hypothetical protein [Viridibacillus arvi]|uniref:hypothetical protein n=1 Tax=Viridibacillus arvi TaxID=263475 RepID=UPI0034CEE0EB